MENISFELHLREQRAAFGFPSVIRAKADGLLTMGGDLNPVRLLVAYASGIFPWPCDGVAQLPWFCPSPRPVLIPGAIHLGKSTVKSIRKERLEISFDTAFGDVIQACAGMKRHRQHGTWITEEMICAYVQLHEAGFAHSVEAWRHGNLVGGVYGVSLGAAFFGESMFRTESNASKIALIALMRRLKEWGFKFLDCQMRTPIANSLGAVDWDAATFQAALSEALKSPTRRTGWKTATEIFELRDAAGA
jgi:leucyl/phenylalanyl-tRNA--protein transferase